MLCDSIMVMSEGRLAAQGTTLDLKSRFGVGYTLTIVTPQGPGGSPSASPAASPHHPPVASGAPAASPAATPARSTAAAAAAALQTAINALVCGHVPGAQLVSAAGAELAYRLPKGESGAFAELLRGLEARQEELGIGGYGLSVTTLEEVFLAITTQAEEGRAAHARQGGAAAPQRPLPPAAASAGDVEKRRLTG